MLRKFTCVLVKKQLGSWQRQLGKTAVIKAGAYIVSIEKRIQAVHSNAFPYFTGPPVSSSLYHLYSSRARLHNDTVQAPCDMLV